MFPILISPIKYIMISHISMYDLLAVNVYVYRYVPAMENARWNVVGIHRETNRCPNSTSWPWTNCSRMSGSKDLSMPGNRKLANAQPLTTYQPHPSSSGRVAVRNRFCDGITVNDNIILYLILNTIIKVISEKKKRRDKNTERIRRQDPLQGI